MKPGIIIILLLSLLMQMPAVGQQVYEYHFRNNLSEQGGGGPALNALGTAAYTNEALPVSCLDRPVYSFAQNEGVQFDNASGFITDEYSIEMYFRFTNISGYMRVIDFKNRSVDSGLYVNSSQILFYDELAISSSVFSTTDYAHLLITRNGTSDLVSVYVNGSIAGTFTDTYDRALPGVDDLFNFFRDDTISGGEAQPGHIALLRIYDYELNSTEVSNSYSNMEDASATVAFDPDINSACLTGNVFNFTNTSQNSGGVTYAWQFGDGNSSSGTNASHSYASIGNYTVLLIADNGGGCTDSASASVSVVTGTTPTITPSGSVYLCTGGSVTLTASSGTSYLWSTGATTQAILVSNAGTYTVTVTDGACYGVSDPVTVTKHSSIPGGINYINGPAIACPGQSYVYTTNNVLRAVYYTWTLPTGATISGQSSYQTTDTSVTIDFDAGFTTGGTIQVTAFNGCGTRIRTKNVNPTPPVTPQPITGPTSVCPGIPATFSTAADSVVDTYNWTAPAGSSISGQGSNQVDITFPIGFTSGYIYVTATNTCGTSNQRALLVRSIPAPPTQIFGPSNALCGTTQAYTIDTVQDALSYTWTAPAGASVVAGQGTDTVQIDFTTGFTTGYVRVTSNNSCGSSSYRNLLVSGDVLISDDPDSSSVCSGDQVVFSVSASGTGINYQWRKGGVAITDTGAFNGSATATLTINPADSSYMGLYDCVLSRSCGNSDTSAVALLNLDDGLQQPGAVSGPAVACSGNQGFAYSVAPVAGVTYYYWSGNTGVTIVSGQGTPNVTVDFGTTTLSGYEIYVQSQAACGLSDTSMIWVRTSVSTPSFTTAPSTVCAGTTGEAFEVATVAGADTYTWTGPANTTIASGQGTNAVTIDFGAGFTSGQVCVTASNICFTSPQRCKNVISTPNRPGNIQGVSHGVCNTTKTYTVNPVANATSYTWTVSTGATIASGQGTNSIEVDFGPSFTSGTVEVVSVNSCGNSPSRSRTVYGAPVKPAAITGNAAPCSGSTGNVYSVDPLPGATFYSWTVPSGASITSGATSNSITVDFGTNTGNITARGENSCGSGAKKYLAIVFTCRLADVETTSGNLFSLYPNPASDLIRLNFTHELTGSGKISLLDPAGRLISEVNVNDVEAGEELLIDIESLPAGLYIVSIQHNNSLMHHKFIKQ